MDLTNEFTVNAPLERAWAVLTDVETIAPCLPGAQLQEIDGEEYRGVVKVKVGPITAQYKGAAHFVEVDEAGRRVVLKGEGRDTRGQGNASALVTAELVAAGQDATTVKVTTDLTVSGKVAQFGRGIMADVSAKLMDQFADNLSKSVLAPSADAEPAAAPSESATATEPAPTAAATSGNGTGDVSAKVRVIDQPEVEPVDLMAAAGSPVLRRLAPLVGVVVVLVVLRWLWRRRH